MAAVRLQDFQLTLACQFPGVDVDFDNPKVTAVVTAARRLHATLPMAVLQISRTNAALKTYRYELTVKGGRTWVQTLQFSASATDPLVTGAVTHAFTVSELLPQYALRDAAIILLGEYNPLSLELVWL